MAKGIYKRTKPVWNKGLTKYTDERVKQYCDKLTTERRSQIVAQSHKDMSIEQKKNRANSLRKFRKGKSFDELFGKDKSEEIKKRMSNLSKENGRLIGKNNPMWKGGITPINDRIRKSKEYKQWRIEVYKKDYFACQQCGYKGKDIIAHHIYPFSKYLEYRFEVKNGITLCRTCHPYIEAIL